jgi:hypothetical protein
MGFIIDECTKVFSKSLKKFAEDGGKELKEISLRLYLKGEGEDREVGYTICHNGQLVTETTMLGVLNIKLQIFDIKGYSLIVPPFIKQFLLDFEQEYGGKSAEVFVIHGREEDEDKEDYEEIIFLLFIDTAFVKRVHIKDLIKEE